MIVYPNAKIDCPIQGYVKVHCGKECEHYKGQQSSTSDIYILCKSSKDPIKVMLGEGYPSPVYPEYP